jgi:L-erythro-3,5-diaminohexanoate dehydrogenase
MKNPVTGSGGMFIGTVLKIGEALEGKIDLKKGGGHEKNIRSKVL